MDELQQYVVKTMNNLENGQLPAYAEPGLPTATGPLTDDEILRLRKLLKEIDDRFTGL